MAPKNLLKGFKRPSKIVFEHDELQKDYGRFIAEPFEKGYGLTVGNSLRRVLLSSIEGSAITAIKIEGVPHEFHSIEGVYEDVTKIILNLKKLRLRYHGELPKVMHVVKQGPGELTGADFNIDSDIEIMNLDLKIATLNEKAKIDLEIQVEKGRGYVPAELNKGNTETIGVIPIDAIFTPVKKVNVKVEDTRVGQRTDYDKLTIEVWTDGAVSPDDALAQAAKIIKDHMTIFINFEEEIEEEAEVVDESAERIKNVLAKSIDELELSVRAHNTLKSLDINDLESLVRKTEEELKKSKHYSDQILKEIKGRLDANHLSLGLKE
ncbi:MAG TPA: DNA-directed RNA polymerase subunit alpha [Spirochaetota bacterium]|jgi:DNA-directed RNA polymerase subunit alpha|nr:DNA-directed RNA polymerase subunit alpha [Spirochaetota bacterium]OPZ38074.1 MAG: DNA-directed RNA polymerase subunit alpha [Spirochaetes bacterium ADurb.BinA120]HNU91891.1 DNA-directed RNA polymerase subunit alpha [Spirochaetota bacterium]HPI13815.1 DNA-directed RNA polymerase subunit alpha [Spirochaetota bacterium]HPO44380.1 DNA-directed RNA polymerase subunit alpha [Spirochaetota bacterium]